jgi:hypothetical protein
MSIFLTRSNLAGKFREMPAYLSVEISLRDVKPRIWRRFLIRKSASLFDLHQAIQDACGFRQCGPHAFIRGRRHLPVAGDFSPLAMVDDVPDPQKVKVGQALQMDGERGSRRLRYHYRPDAHWELEVWLKEEVDLPERFFRRLQAGRRAFPPEDCQGISEYERLCAFMEEGSDPWGEDPEELEDWLAHWEPDTFKLDVVSQLFFQRAHRAHPLLIPIRPRTIQPLFVLAPGFTEVTEVAEITHPEGFIQIS